jgi:hypothetical protein
VRIGIIIFFILSVLYLIQKPGVNDVTILLFGNKVLIWRVLFFTNLYLMLSIAFFSYRKKCFVKFDRSITFYAGMFTSVLTLYNISTFFASGPITYVQMCNSWIGGIILAVLLIITLIVLRYDKGGS